MANELENTPLDDFTASLGAAAPPDGLDNALQALWYEARANGPGATPPADGDGNMSSDWRTAQPVPGDVYDAVGVPCPRQRLLHKQHQVLLLLLRQLQREDFVGEVRVLRRPVAGPPRRRYPATK